MMIPPPPTAQAKRMAIPAPAARWWCGPLVVVALIAASDTHEASAFRGCSCSPRPFLSRTTPRPPLTRTHRVISTASVDVRRLGVFDATIRGGHPSSVDDRWNDRGRRRRGNGRSGSVVAKLGIAAPGAGEAKIDKTSVISPSGEEDEDDEVHRKVPDDDANEEDDDDDDDAAASAFDVLALRAVECLFRSDLKRSSGFDGASTGWTSWLDGPSESRLADCVGRLTLSTIGDDVGGGGVGATTKTTPATEVRVDVDAVEEDEEEMIRRWVRWMRSIPAPVVVELSDALRESADRWYVDDDDLKRIDSSRSAFLSRMGCRLFLLPSGAELNRPLGTPPAGGVAYGRLLYGGVVRSRLLSGGRRAGERTAVLRRGGDVTTGTTNGGNPSWCQYGGPERTYRAVDMGPAAVLELILLPTGLALPTIGVEGVVLDGDDDDDAFGNEMSLSRMDWDPSVMFRLVPFKEEGVSGESNSTGTPGGRTEESAPSPTEVCLLSGRERNDFFESTFTERLGGLRPQIDSIVRRVLDGRVIRPEGVVDPDGDIPDEPFIRGHDDGVLTEAAELASLGLSPVRGLLLYGPPGCGKTALAREIANCLTERRPKIVAAPELLDRWVGGSERLVRELFADAEEELRICGDDPNRSALHVIVIDEIDAVFRRRGAAADSGEATRSSAVNQILAKLDGVRATPNVLLVGITNRRELLDDALLRPGRLEVQVHIPLPDREARREIFQIHFAALRRNGRLSQPLCRAIDGLGRASKSKHMKPTRPFLSKNIGLRRFTRYALNLIRFPIALPRVDDLCAEEVTGGFSGADCAGLVRCAGSIALSRSRKTGAGVEDLLITLEDVIEALEEVKR